MRTPSTRNSILTLAALALSGSLALAQAAPAQPAPAAAPAAAPQPSARPRPGMHQGMRPGMSRGDRHGDVRGGMMQHGRANFRSGGPGGHFRGGERGPMGMGGIGPAGTWWKNPAIVERLTLTADQTRKMDDIVEQSRLQLIDLHANLEKQQVMLEPMLSANPLDTAKASSQIDKVANARADLEKADAKMLLNIRGVLTPDQWTKLHERRTPEAQGAPAPAGGPGAAGGPGSGGPGGGGRWRGPRPGGPGGNGMDNVVPQIGEQ